MTAPKVEVGQIWADNDWRMEGRTVRVIDIVGTKVIVENVTNSRFAVTSTVGRRSRIGHDKFMNRKRGFSLIETEGT